MTDPTIAAVAHGDLNSELMVQLHRLFDAEYLDSHGSCDADLPYGCAPHDCHVVAWQGNEAVGHVGWAKCTIGMGSYEVVIAGIEEC